MKPLTLLFFGILLFPQSSTLESKLESMIWKNRVLVVFSPSPNDPQYIQQKKWLGEVGKDLLERDMKVLECVGKDITAEDEKYLKSRFKYSPNEFCAWLIGKDGGVKLLKNKAIHPQELFGLIDSMPMRRQEMKKG
ncbi:MAG: DUF4174 domain-containing protein [Runella sp.]